MNRVIKTEVLSFEEQEATEWYNEHNRQLESLGLNPNDSYAFIKLEKHRWGNELNKCTKCSGVLTIGQTRLCTKCMKKLEE